MPSIAPLIEAARPQLPMRPTPHERDGRQPAPSTGRPHPQRAIADEIGPRRPGAIYQNTDGRFEVLALITDPREAAQLLRRDCAQWALIVRDTLRPDGQPFGVGTVWMCSDYLIRPATPAYAPAA
ncbi:hypothetical protein OG985_48720 (plasmid) [Streptomyces sp. NBC_00289]|uniref:hypothetical protein n=1 Tax=Streptomyces sp. NBC_00289 TaxID=2975703 RepID=UPI00324CFFE0